jgi:hypothetical protein
MRSPDNARTKSKKTAKIEVSNSPRALRAWLAEPFDGTAQYVMIRMGRGLGSTTVKAQVNLTGTLYSPVPAGTAVTISTLRGIIQVLSVESSFNSGVLATISKGCMLTRNSVFSVADSIDTLLQFGAIVRNDLGLIISGAITALPSGGTVSKTTGSTTITGTGTKFLDDLSPGNIIQIPGGTTENLVVVDIGSQTSMTVQIAATNTATGQTCSKTNIGLAIPNSGWWIVVGQIEWAGNATGSRGLYILQNSIQINRARLPTVSSGNAHLNVTAVQYFNQYDLVSLLVSQNSTAALNVVNSSAGPSLSIMTAVA